MHVLFVHRAFPAQFGRLALELTQRYGWKCTCLFQHLSRCPGPTPEMLERLELCPIQGGPPPGKGDQVPWAQVHGQALEMGRQGQQPGHDHRCRARVLQRNVFRR